MQRTKVGVGRAGSIAAFGNGVHRPLGEEAKKRKAVGEHHDGSFGVYMAHKIQKLRGQNASFIGSSHADGSDETARGRDETAPRMGEDGNMLGDGGDAVAVDGEATSTGKLFGGVHVYVDGYTVPSKEEIRSLMLLHGGGFEHYETSQVTHIVATHLATSKLLQYARRRHPPRVVRPEWIVKSIEAKTLLPVQPYLYRGFADPTQGSVLSGLSLSASASSTGKSQAQSPARRGEAVVSNPREEEDDEAEEDDHSFSESEGASDEDDLEALVSQYASQHVVPAAQHDSSSSREQVLTGDSRQMHTSADCIVRTNSTRDGPAFVRHFFAKSRLHHIGSWRTTFQLRAGEFLSKYQGPPFTQEHVTSTDRVILHVDMDCFFVSVAVRDKPQYDDKPIAIAHSGNAGSSEISSCNYLAREKGLRAGMFMQSAKALCPELVVLPYQFEEIEACSFQIYDIFFSRTPYVQAMSCDEAYLEFDKTTDGVAMAKEIRQAIYETTRCTASVGVSYNILLAKLATREAKPDGLFQIATPEQAEPFLTSLKISDLPGVGHRMSAKMDELGLESLEQLRAVTKFELQQQFGKTTSEMLFKYARGVDHRSLTAEANMMRKSVSAVVNFGIRFQTWHDATEFMMALAEELSTRLKSLKVRTKCLTLLIKKRREGAPVVPSKFMGMGICDSFSKSQILSEATDSDLVVGRSGIELLRQFRFPVEELRGVGLQATKLVSLLKSVETKTGQRFRAWLADSDSSHAQQAPSSDATSRPEPNRYVETMPQINADVLDELPEAIREEVLASYRSRRPPPAPAPGVLQPPRAKGKQKLVVSRPANRSLFTAGPTSAATEHTSGQANTLNDIRLSQVDGDVYEALPLAIRREIDAHTKKSKGARVPKPARQPQEEPHQQTLVQKKTELMSIEALFSALADSISKDGENPLVQTPVDPRAAFDAILSRILAEIEGKALDNALRMLRFVRRKCHQLVTSVSLNSSSDFVRHGFNHVLQQINDDLRQHYLGSFSARLVPPL